MKNLVTTQLGKALIIAALNEAGYNEVYEKDGYIFAEHPEDVNNLIILSASRKLSQKDDKQPETNLFSLNPKQVEKLQRYTDTIAGDYTACLAYAVCKYSYYDLECAIFPLDTWSTWSGVKRGGVLSYTETKGYFYNYTKADQGLPNSMILRQCWTNK